MSDVRYRYVLLHVITCHVFIIDIHVKTTFLVICIVCIEDTKVLLYIHLKLYFHISKIYTSEAAKVLAICVHWTV